MITLASHQITCATKVHPHRHIVRVGGPSGSWSVEQARAAIARGEVFFTVSPSTRKQARVERYTCSCGVLTLRSSPDAVTDNNLDNLRNC
ncbi:MAG: DUF3892 domain-containing protein [Acidimicrobiia bacterium]